MQRGGLLKSERKRCQPPNLGKMPDSLFLVALTFEALLEEEIGHGDLSVILPTGRKPRLVGGSLCKFDPGPLVFPQRQVRRAGGIESVEAVGGEG